MEIKGFEPLSHKLIMNAFNHHKIKLVTDLVSFEKILLSFDLSNSVLLLMSSGNFNGFDYKKIKKILSEAYKSHILGLRSYPLGF